MAAIAAREMEKDMKTTIAILSVLVAAGAASASVYSNGPF